MSPPWRDARVLTGQVSRAARRSAGIRLRRSVAQGRTRRERASRIGIAAFSSLHPSRQRSPRKPDLRRSGSYSVPFASATENRTRLRILMPSTLRPSRPAFVPRTTGRRQETTGTAGASNPQVRSQIRASPQVAKSAPRTLSRWRHGFEPRWDYHAKRAGHRPSLDRCRPRTGDFRARLIPRISRGRSELAICAVGLVMLDPACRFPLHRVTARDPS
jgi:hypothetical protein